MFAGRRRVGRSDQQMMNDAKNAERMAAVGETAFNKMKNNLRLYLGRFFKLSVLQMLANATATTLGYTIDRCSRRKLDILILWLIERWGNIGNLFVQYMNNYLMNPEAFQVVENSVAEPGIEEVEPGVEASIQLRRK